MGVADSARRIHAISPGISNFESVSAGKRYFLLARASISKELRSSQVRSRAVRRQPARRRFHTLRRSTDKKVSPNSNIYRALAAIHGGRAKAPINCLALPRFSVKSMRRSVQFFSRFIRALSGAGRRMERLQKWTCTKDGRPDLPILNSSYPCPAIFLKFLHSSMHSSNA